MNIWDELLKVYNMPGIPDEAMSIIGDVMLAWSERQEGDTISRKVAVDSLEKCMTCKHVYQRIDDADTMYCRCRKGCRHEEYKPKRSNRSSQGHED